MSLNQLSTRVKAINHLVQSIGFISTYDPHSCTYWGLSGPGNLTVLVKFVPNQLHGNENVEILTKNWQLLRLYERYNSRYETNTLDQMIDGLNPS